MSRLRSMVGWLAPALAIVASIGWLGLTEPTETRYAEVAREMLESGDWLTPRLNGIPHFESAPLAYWTAATGMALLGVNEWGARLGVALAAAFILWCTARIGKLAGGTLAPAFLATTFLFFVASHQLSSDIFLAAAVAGFFVAMLDPRMRATVWPFVALAVGFLAKGPVVFVSTVFPVLLASLWTRDASPARALANWRGWIVFAVIGLPWYLVVVAKTPGLLDYFLHGLLWDRFITDAHHRVGPIYYVLVVILFGTFPWTWAALRGLVEATRAAGAQRNVADALLASWIFVPSVFFTISASKLPGYLLPIFPALAVLASCVPKEAERRLWLKGSAVTLAVLLALLAAATPFSDRFGSPRSIVERLEKARKPGELVVMYGRFNAGVPFYLRETVAMVDVPRDFTFADPGARERVVNSRSEFARRVRARGSAWVVGNAAATDSMATPLGFKVTRVAGSGDQTLHHLQWRW